MDDNAVIATLSAITPRMAQTGIRRLLVIAGDDEWSQRSAQGLASALPGDWLWTGPETALSLSFPHHCAPRQLRTLLGREFRHGVFDARHGLDAEALAAMGGTLMAGSWLILLTPPFGEWPHRPDDDSLRWGDCPDPIPAPRFIHHLLHTLRHDPDVVLWEQHQGLTLNDGASRATWCPAQGAPAQEQAAILGQLRQMDHGVAVVTAARGRGKSALAGMLLRHWPGPSLVTAPARVATDVLARYSGDAFRFMAPDALLEAVEQGAAPAADWLVIDEAAAIPGPLLTRLITAYPRTLLTTTVQGYEGTGRGFLLKFCARFPGIQHYALQTPMRWAAGDPLERVMDALFLFDDLDVDLRPEGAVTLGPVTGERDARTMADIYRLLSAAHYRTTPLDLRRMLDGPGQRFMVARTESFTVGALWMVEEGNLEPGLSQAVWAGFRRPRGNLVAQSLAAHGGSPLAATLRGVRISRIAVYPTRQGQGMGQAMVAAARQAIDVDADYLSVSFGFTQQLWRFWQRCGFTLVRIGSHREASSGCYNAMAILPLTARGRELADREYLRLCRDWPWLEAWIDESIPVSPRNNATLNDDDWLELAGFAFAHRPLEACYGSLGRLLRCCEFPLPALRGRLEQHQSTEVLCREQQLAGRKALLGRWRQDAALALEKIDADRAAALKFQIMQLQFFQ